MSSPGLIAIVNQSTKATNDEVAAIARACYTQLRYHAAPAWHLTPSAVIFYSVPADVPPGAHRIAIVDSDPGGSAGTLGWHTEDKSGIYGIAAVDPVVSNGGKVLVGDWSLASVVAHEVLEMFVDQSCRDWSMADDGFLYAREVGDPVEGPTYTVRPHGGPEVSLCNFVLPAWFDNAAPGPYDHLGLLKKPFSLLDTGYVIKMAGGKETEVFGAEFPEWRHGMKADNPFSRTARRRAQ